MDSRNKEVTEKKSKTILSRRNFLKLAAATAAAYVMREGLNKTADIWQPAVVDLGINALENPAIIESALSSSASFLEQLALKDQRSPDAPVVNRNETFTRCLR